MREGEGQGEKHRDMKLERKKDGKKEHNIKSINF